MSKFVRALLAAVALLSAPAFAADQAVTGAAEWQAVSTSGVVKIDGKGAVVAGTVSVADGKASGTLEADLSAMTTGMDLRDKHMKEKYLETAKHPKATLVLDPVAAGEKDFEWTGKLTLKGETKPVKGTGRVKGKDVWAKFVVSLADYPSVGVPEWLGVTVAKEVTVIVKATAVPK